MKSRGQQDRFSIEIDPEDSAIGRIAIGRITIDDFSETFELNCSRWTTADYRLSWTQALREFLADPGGSIVLMTWCCPPPEVGVQRGWILHHGVGTVYVQERIFVPRDHPGPIDPAGQFVDQGPRERFTEDGHPISEWETSLEAIDAFLCDESRT